MDDLPTDYDTIVVGTGMPECILAAAHARNGRKVLHLDRNDYYGGPWASFSFTALESWIAECKNSLAKEHIEEAENHDLEQFLNEGESVMPCNNGLVKFTDFKVQVNVPTKIEKVEKDEIASESDDNKSEAETECSNSQPETPKEQWSLDKIKLLYRKFNLDLAPKLLFSRGELVDLLISSNIARYAEFKSVTRVLTHFEGNLELVPCSRADVFSTKNVSVVEKRMLMKLLTFCMNYEQNETEYEGFLNKSFLDFLKSRKLTDNIIYYVMHAIAMVDESVLTLEGLESTRRFLNSLGRFGNTPFLWPLYGSGELPQCFCRLCAVYGGIYYLKRDIEAVIINSDNVCSGIISGGKRMNCKWLVMETSYAPVTFIPNNCTKKISRAIVITDKSLMPAEKEQITFLRLPKGDKLQNTVSVMELGPGAMVCPPDLFVVYLTMKSVESEVDNDLIPVMKLLFGTQNDSDSKNDPDRPKVLWSLFFNQNYIPEHDMVATLRPSNVILTNAPSSSIDFDDAVIQARTLFQAAFPDEEFLPRAPDPDEIVIEGVEDAEPTTAAIISEFTTELSGKDSDDVVSIPENVVSCSDNLPLEPDPADLPTCQETDQSELLENK